MKLDLSDEEKRDLGNDNVGLSEEEAVADAAISIAFFANAWTRFL
jgi:hypothetical protein